MVVATESGGPELWGGVLSSVLLGKVLLTVAVASRSRGDVARRTVERARRVLYAVLRSE